MRRYLVTFWSTFAGILIITALMNMIADPYVVYRLGPANWNAGKRQQEHWISRGETASRDGFDVLLAGDSRALNGFSPDHPALQSVGRAYNISVAGASLFETQRLLEVALKSSHPPRLIVWSVPAAPGLVPNQVGDDFEWSAASGQHGTLERHLHYLLSLTASNDSLHAIGCLINGHSYNIVKGFQSNPRMSATEAQFLNCIPKLRKPLTTEEINVRLEGSRTTIGSVARQCQKTKTQLVIIFPAVHSLFLKGIVADGGWEVFQGQKSVAVEIAQQVNNEHDLMQVWDFTSFGGVNNEPVVISADQPMNWYTDASHFNRQLGDRILNRVLGYDDSDSGMPDFGTRLTAGNLQWHLAEQKAAIPADRRPAQIAEAPLDRTRH